MQPTLCDLFQAAVERHPNRIALKHKRKGRYQPMTFRELARVVDIVAANLIRLGISKGDAVAIFCENRPEWAIADLAALQIGAVVVPIYPTMPAATVRYILSDARVKLIVLQSEDAVAMIGQLRSELPDLAQVVVVAAGERLDTTLSRFEETLLAPVEAALPRTVVASDDVATIVYTSGTTGEPKGVVLTHGNIAANVRAAISRFGMTSRDVILSYLPLCHMFERTCGFYAVLFSGGTIAFAESVATVTDDVLTVRPTLLIAVPRVLEKGFEHAVQKVSHRSPWGRQLVETAMRNLKDRFDREFRHEPVSRSLKIKCALLDLFVASRFRKIAGGRMRFIACGGAPLDRKIAKAYCILGYQVLEGYGLTEASPIVSCNVPGENRLGTVGRPMEGVDVRIAEQDEVLVRGPNIMRGYLNKPRETAAAIDPEGWLHTGDQGRFDDDGHLIITGRIKELIVTSYGKNVPAAAIEAKITRSPYVSQAMLIGDNRKYLVALLVPNRAAIAEHLGEHKSNASAVTDLLRREVDAATEDCARYEKVKSFAVVEDEFTVASGLLTPTLKLRRKQIAERYRDVIESLYAQADGESA